MKKLVPQYPQSDQARLNAACDSWRLPYWDWAAQKPQPYGNPNYSVPQIVTLPRLDVFPSSGKVENVPNPMYKFTMPDGETMGQQGIGKPRLGIPVCDECPVFAIPR
jgi:tyrosinase